MVNARAVRPLPVPAGGQALDIVPALQRALAGHGPALLPVPYGESADAERTLAALGAGEPLLPDEDDVDDPTVLVIATSGSTGTPKGVLLSASAVRASATATHDRLGGPGHWLLAMPAHHVAGMQVLIRSLVAGTTPSVVDTSHGFRPERFAEAARDTLANGGQHYTALVPTQLRRLLDDDTGLGALRQFDGVLLGGAATPPSLLGAALDAGVRVVTTYGMSETSGGCVYDGVPLEGTRVHLDSSAEQDSGQDVGTIWLSGPMLARGYRRGTSGASPFVDGWFRTGDLGRWRDGVLDVLGRADDLIITGGVNVAPLAVERALTRHEGVREACVLGIDDPEWGQAVVAAVVSRDSSAPPSEDALRTEVRAHLPVAAVPKRFVFLPELPMRGPGKPDKRTLRDMLAGQREP
jgi:O-succinylbenzoic acid--CoA ligase